MSIEIEAAEEAGKVAWGIIKPVLGFIIAAAIGFTAAELFEHRGPGPTIHLPIIGAFHPFGESLEAKLDDLIAAEPAKLSAAQAQGITQQTAADKPAFTKWSDSLASCRADAQSTRDAAAAGLTKDDVFTNAQADQAFKMGKATCGVTDAKLATGGAAGVVPGSGGVPDSGADFAATFEPGAYTAPGQALVPSGSDGAPDVGTPAA